MFWVSRQRHFRFQFLLADLSDVPQASVAWRRLRPNLHSIRMPNVLRASLSFHLALDLRRISLCKDNVSLISFVLPG